MHRCLFCESDRFREFSAFEKMLGLGDEFLYKECLACNSLQISAVPSNLSSYYSSDSYYSFSGLVKSPKLLNYLKFLRMKVYLLSGLRLFMPSYGYWLRHLKPKSNDLIVDIGSGSGQLIYELWASGFKNLIGIDPYISNSATIEKGCNLIKGQLEDLNEKADIIMMHHAFEHMDNPGKVLEACHNSLKPNGKLLIRTPLAGSAAFKEFGENWVQLDAPRHLAIPSLKGFYTLAESNGFIVRQVLFDSTEFQFWGSELYRKGMPLHGVIKENHFSKTELADFKQKSNEYNQRGIGDQVCFYLEVSN